jgi:predicted transcriptional regulator
MTLKEWANFLTENFEAVNMADVIKALEKEGNKVKKVGNLYHVTPRGGDEYSVGEEELKEWYDRVSKLKKPAFNLNKRG